LKFEIMSIYLPFLCVWNLRSIYMSTIFVCLKLKVYMYFYFFCPCLECLFVWRFVFVSMFKCLHVWRFVSFCLKFWGVIIYVWMFKSEPWGLSLKCKSKGLWLWVWDHMYVCPQTPIECIHNKRSQGLCVHVKDLAPHDFEKWLHEF